MQGRPGTRGGRGHGARGMCLVCERHAGGVLHGGGGEGRPRGAVDCVIALSLVGCRACGPATRHIVSVEATTRNYINVRIYSHTKFPLSLSQGPSCLDRIPRSSDVSVGFDLTSLARARAAARDCHCHGDCQLPRHGPDTHTPPTTYVGVTSKHQRANSNTQRSANSMATASVGRQRHLHYCLAHVTCCPSPHLHHHSHNQRTWSP